MLNTENKTMVNQDDFPPPDGSTRSSIPIDSSSGATTALTRESDVDESGDLSESTEVSEYGTDFAAQLRNRRRQVLEKESRDLFAQSLKKHREHLVDAWEENHTNAGVPQDEEEKDGEANSGGIKEDGGTKVNGEPIHLERRETSTVAVLVALEEGLNDDDGDDDFGAFEDGKLGDISNMSSVDDSFFDSSILSPNGSGCDVDRIGTSDDLVSSPYFGDDNDTIQPEAEKKSPSTSSAIVGSNGDATYPHGFEEKGNGASNEFPGRNVSEEHSNASEQCPSHFMVTTKDASVDLGLVPLAPSVGSTVELDENFFGDFAASSIEVEGMTQVRSDSTDKSSQDRSGEQFAQFHASPRETKETSDQLTLGECIDSGIPQRTGSADGDVFEDFDETKPSSTKHIETLESATEGGYLGDQESGGMGGAVNSQSHEAIQDYEDETCDDFGDSGSSQSRAQVCGDNDGIVDDALNGLHDPQVLQQSPGTSADNTDDHALFGDFDDGGAVLSQSRRPLEEHDDSFGDFDDAGLYQHHTVASTASADENISDGDLDNGVPPQSQPETSHDSGGNVAPSQLDLGPSIEEENNDTVFGEFGNSAPSEPQPIASYGDDRAFGEFDDGTPVQPQAVSGVEVDDDAAFGDNAGLNRQLPIEDDDDEVFGDFDDAGPSQPADVSSFKNDDDDDFGDFDDAGPSRSREHDHDAEFGDFDDPAQLNPQTVSSVENDDDNDAFGDFDDVRPSPPRSSVQPPGGDQSFGNFDYAPAVASESLTPVAPIGDKARGMFAKMQEKYPFPNSDVDETGNDERGDSETTFGNLLASHKTTLKNEGSLKFELLEQALSGLSFPKGACKLIIEGDGAGPWFPFMYPVSGLHAREFQVERHRRSSIRSTNVPDVLPIQLPTGREMPLNASSPVSPRKKTSLTPTIGLTIPELSHKKQHGYEGEVRSEASSAKTEQLLSRVPNLNFMLQSSLSLP
jgi:hypothetical protein